MLSKTLLNQRFNKLHAGGNRSSLIKLQLKYKLAKESLSVLPPKSSFKLLK